jgi:putative serine protease PepD
MGISSKVVAMALVAVAATAAGFAGLASSLRDAQLANQRQSAQLKAQAAEIGELERGLAELQAAPTAPDWIAIAKLVEPSVVTIETRVGLGSGWVATSDASGSSIVTNYHVIAGAWEAGSASVTVRQFDNSYRGTIGKVDPTDDLAVVGIHERLTSLAAAPARPKQAQPVMALGSPQGFDGTVATGIVSGYRSIAGADYIQFSAPISPGNSGGPLVDANGRVVGVASAKWVGTGVEALAFAIPVQTVCTVLVSCRSAG